MLVLVKRYVGRVPSAVPVARLRKECEGAVECEAAAECEREAKCERAAELGSAK